MNICGREILVHGRLFRIARLDGEKYNFLDDPEPLMIECAIRHASRSLYVLAKTARDDTEI